MAAAMGAAVFRPIASELEELLPHEAVVVLDPMIWPVSAFTVALNVVPLPVAVGLKAQVEYSISHSDGTQWPKMQTLPTRPYSAEASGQAARKLEARGSTSAAA